MITDTIRKEMAINKQTNARNHCLLLLMLLYATGVLLSKRSLGIKNCGGLFRTGGESPPDRQSPKRGAPAGRPGEACAQSSNYTFYQAIRSTSCSFQSARCGAVVPARGVVPLGLRYMLDQLKDQTLLIRRKM